jgi:hypothetical protein
MTYSTDKKMASNLETITAERARQVIEMNKRGEKPLSLQEESGVEAPAGPVDLATQENINRFDRAKKKKKKKKPANRPGNGDQQAKGQTQAPQDAQ